MGAIGMAILHICARKCQKWADRIQHQEADNPSQPLRAQRWRHQCPQSSAEYQQRWQNGDKGIAPETPKHRPRKWLAVDTEQGGAPTKPDSQQAQPPELRCRGVSLPPIITPGEPGDAKQAGEHQQTKWREPTRADASFAPAKQPPKSLKQQQRLPWIHGRDPGTVEQLAKRALVE